MMYYRERYHDSYKNRNERNAAFQSIDDLRRKERKGLPMTFEEKARLKKEAEANRKKNAKKKK